jgi:hypothetical protein
MQILTTDTRNNIQILCTGLLLFSLIFATLSCSSPQGRTAADAHPAKNGTHGSVPDETDHFPVINALLISPRNPSPGEPFRIMATGGKNLRKAKIIISSPEGRIESLGTRNGDGLPYWRIDDFAGCIEGTCKVSLVSENKEVCSLEFVISSGKPAFASEKVWKSLRDWDGGSEALYAAWINALFNNCDERASWTALHEVTQNRDRNFLFNCLSLGEDNVDGKNKVIMQPDCADNPFFLRAYFAWKLGLPFGYHVCDRGSVGHPPKTGRWITNETPTEKSDPVQSFNSFLRKLMDGVHSGTARTALKSENSDYYPVPLQRGALRPGTVFADPYGHTLIITGWLSQTHDHPGVLLSIDAQPDGTVGIKRFWKGNFLFNTSEVVGEPGFKAFRPITMQEGVPVMLKNEELTLQSGFIPFSLQQNKMESGVFYHTMERLINPKPLDPEAALLDLIRALHEQLLVRVTSVANGEAYLKSHPGTVIPMPSNAAGIFLAGGQWENFSTPNRDLRLLIAMDAVLEFPDQIVSSPEDFNISGIVSPEQVRKKLQSLLEEKVSGLSISYTRTDGSEQKLTLAEIIKRRDAFEMAYNPNDGIEIRWGAAENSEERATCHRHAPLSQLQTMRSAQGWFRKRLHPPT